MDNNEIKDHIEKKRAEILAKTELTTYQSNILIYQALSAFVENRKTQRYGQLLRNSGIIKEVNTTQETPEWINDMRTTSQEILRRLGGADKVLRLTKAHLKNHSGLKPDKKPKEGVNTRYDYNRLIQSAIMTTISTYPDWSFSKILRSLEVVQDAIQKPQQPTRWKNEFNTESEATYKRVHNNLFVVKRVKDAQSNGEK